MRSPIRPSGLRRLTPGLLIADHMAEGFIGLSEGVKPGQVLAALKAAAPRLGIAPRLVYAVDWLFRFTQPQDWEQGSRPIVWPSAAMQAEAFGLSSTQVKSINRRLIDLCLITMKDSPTGKRYGHRDPKGRIVEAYGFDLSPIAVRYSEFCRVAEEAKAERIAMGRLRRRATIARKAIVQILETAREYGFHDEGWAQTLARETDAIARALRAADRVDDMKVGVDSLERRQCAARERLETLLMTVETDPTGSKNRPHKYNYNPTQNYENDTVITAEECSGAREEAGAQSPAPVQPKRPDKSMVQGIRPDELVRLTPKLKPYLGRPSPTWPDIIEAADWLRHDLGISKPLWGEACITMGRELAAVAVAIISSKDPGHFTGTPGGYFYGMVVKAKTGQLHLGRTIWALRRGTSKASVLPVV